MHYCIRYLVIYFLPIISLNWLGRKCIFGHFRTNILYVTIEDHHWPSCHSFRCLPEHPGDPDDQHGKTIIINTFHSSVTLKQYGSIDVQYRMDDLICTCFPGRPVVPKVPVGPCDRKNMQRYGLFQTSPYTGRSLSRSSTDERSIDPSSHPGSLYI